MRSDLFNRLKADLATVSAPQILELEDVIHRVLAQQFAAIALARRTRAATQTRLCPHCKSNNSVLHGKDHNLRQRFKCRACQRTYNILTGTALARARKPEKWGDYLGYMTDHHSIRAIGTDEHRSESCHCVAVAPSLSASLCKR